MEGGPVRNVDSKTPLLESGDEEAEDGLYTAETPSDLHVLTCVLALAPEIHPQLKGRNTRFSTCRRLGYLLLSFLLVILQMGATAAFLAGLTWPTCSDAEKCPTGFYCAFDTHKRLVKDNNNAPVTGICHDCPVSIAYYFDRRVQAAEQDGKYQCGLHYANATYSKPQKGYCDRPSSKSRKTSANSLFHPSDKDESECEARVHWIGRVCDSCKGDSEIYASFPYVVRSRVQNMRYLEWIMVSLVFVMTTLTVVGGVQHCQMVEMVRRLVAETSAREHPDRGCCRVLPNLWHVAVIAVIGFRRCILLPLVVCTIPLIILYRGTNAIEVGMNTVTILFIFEVDRLVFYYFVSDDTLTWAGKQRINVLTGDRRNSTLANYVYMVCISAAMLLVINLGQYWHTWFPELASILLTLSIPCVLSAHFLSSTIWEMLLLVRARACRDRIFLFLMHLVVWGLMTAFFCAVMKASQLRHTHSDWVQETRVSWTLAQSNQTALDSIRGVPNMSSTIIAPDAERNLFL